MIGKGNFHCHEAVDEKGTAVPLEVYKYNGIAHFLNIHQIIIIRGARHKGRSHKPRLCLNVTTK